jgi:cyclopropane fatty-acyl-phospholipid synthase-like methyltransferase
MDNHQSKRVDHALSAHRRALEKINKAKKFELDQVKSKEMVDFVGQPVYKEAFQDALDNMEQDARLMALHEEMVYRTNERMVEMADKAKENDDNSLKGNAKSLALEYGSLVGLEEYIEDDNAVEDGLTWVADDYIRDLHDQRRTLNYLFDAEED